MNESTGGFIWPSRLAAFLASLDRSPWIGVVLAVRSSYEEIVIPEEVRTRTVQMTHAGFADHEYDAAKAFFVYYGLELPSTPLLAPEFRNPLFLKTLCQGLRANGEYRLPRGFHGVTAVFDLYLGAVDDRLASGLDFDPRTSLVPRALAAFVEAVLDWGRRWLTLARAGGGCKRPSPGRSFEASLYRGLVVEGVLVEESVLHQGGDPEEVVFVAYERFIDHLTARTLLDRHLDTADPVSAFAPGSPLAFIGDASEYVEPGLLEALCVQIPEHRGRELFSVAPDCADRWYFGDAFRQSLICARVQMRFPKARAVRSTNSATTTTTTATPSTSCLRSPRCRGIRLEIISKLILAGLGPAATKLLPHFCFKEEQRW